MPGLCRNLALAVLAVCAAHAGSNIDPEHSLTESAFIGEIDWRAGSEHGASINQYYCSGSVYGRQVGWIQLGAGTPADGLRYRNNSAADFGVNVLSSGALRGFAYGANIGWISFEEQGNPRVDWSTGLLHGSIYSANCGWIPLSGTEGSIRLTSVGEAADVDGDELPDAWEMSHTGSLALLSGETDSDGDTQTDLQEFEAGTDPLDASEKLGPIRIASNGSRGFTIQWSTKPGHVYVLEGRASLDSSSGWESVTNAPMTGTGSEAIIDLTASIDSPGFFRVRAFPPLTGLN